MVRVVECLCVAGYLDADIGQWGGNRRGTRSRMKAREPLLARFRACGIRPYMVETTREGRPVRLRDTDGNDSELPSDPVFAERIREMSENVERINEAISDAFIRLHISDEDLNLLALRMAGGEQARYIDFSRKELYRVFNNGSLDEGGRFVGGWWQNIPSDFRKFIHVAHRGHHHRNVAEIDYSSMHPAIAYATVGVSMDFDPYAVEPEASSVTNELRQSVRKVAKRALNILLNAHSRTAARRALVSHLVRERDRNGSRPSEQYLPLGCPGVDRLFDMLIERNMPIARYMGTGGGTRLMNIESIIAEKTMLRVLDRTSATVLPVHHSFIVHQSYRVDLEQFMREAFEETLDHPCDVELDPMEYDDRRGDLSRGASAVEIAEQRQAWEQQASVFFTMWNAWQNHDQYSVSSHPVRNQ